MFSERPTIEVPVSNMGGRRRIGIFPPEEISKMTGHSAANTRGFHIPQIGSIGINPEAPDPFSEVIHELGHPKLDKLFTEMDPEMEDAVRGLLKERYEPTRLATQERIPEYKKLSPAEVHIEQFLKDTQNYVPAGEKGGALQRIQERLQLDAEKIRPQFEELLERSKNVPVRPKDMNVGASERLPIDLSAEALPSTEELVNANRARYEGRGVEPATLPSTEELIDANRAKYEGRGNAQAVVEAVESPSQGGIRAREAVGSRTYEALNQEIDLERIIKPEDYGLKPGGEIITPGPQPRPGAKITIPGETPPGGPPGGPIVLTDDYKFRPSDAGIVPEAAGVTGIPKRGLGMRALRGVGALTAEFAPWMFHGPAIAGTAEAMAGPMITENVEAKKLWGQLSPTGGGLSKIGEGLNTPLVGGVSVADVGKAGLKVVETAFGAIEAPFNYMYKKATGDQANTFTEVMTEGVKQIATGLLSGPAQLMTGYNPRLNEDQVIQAKKDMYDQARPSTGVLSSIQNGIVKWGLEAVNRVSYAGDKTRLEGMMAVAPEQQMSQEQYKAYQEAQGKLKEGIDRKDLSETLRDALKKGDDIQEKLLREVASGKGPWKEGERFDTTGLEAAAQRRLGPQPTLETSGPSIMPGTLTGLNRVALAAFNPSPELTLEAGPQSVETFPGLETSPVGRGESLRTMKQDFASDLRDTGQGKLGVERGFADAPSYHMGRVLQKEFGHGIFSRARMQEQKHNIEAERENYERIRQEMVEEDKPAKADRERRALAEQMYAESQILPETNQLPYTVQLPSGVRTERGGPPPVRPRPESRGIVREYDPDYEPGDRGAVQDWTRRGRMEAGLTDTYAQQKDSLPKQGFTYQPVPAGAMDLFGGLTRKEVELKKGLMRGTLPAPTSDSVRQYLDAKQQDAQAGPGLGSVLQQLRKSGMSKEYIDKVREEMQSGNIAGGLQPGQKFNVKDLANQYQIKYYEDKYGEGSAQAMGERNRIAGQYGREATGIANQATGMGYTWQEVAGGNAGNYSERYREVANKSWETSEPNKYDKNNPYYVATSQEDYYQTKHGQQAAYDIETAAFEKHPEDVDARNKYIEEQKAAGYQTVRDKESDRDRADLNKGAKELAQNDPNWKKANAAYDAAAQAKNTPGISDEEWKRQDEIQKQSVGTMVDIEQKNKKYLNREPGGVRSTQDMTSTNTGVAPQTVDTTPRQAVPTVDTTPQTTQAPVDTTGQTPTYPQTQPGADTGRTDNAALQASLDGLPAAIGAAVASALADKLGGGEGGDNSKAVADAISNALTGALLNVNVVGEVQLAGGGLSALINQELKALNLEPELQKQMKADLDLAQNAIDEIKTKAGLEDEGGKISQLVAEVTRLDTNIQGALAAIDEMGRKLDITAEKARDTGNQPQNSIVTTPPIPA
jgi:hypothetical protein